MQAASEACRDDLHEEHPAVEDTGHMADDRARSKPSRLIRIGE
jgi:hypothetical protein